MSVPDDSHCLVTEDAMKVSHSRPGQVGVQKAPWVWWFGSTWAFRAPGAAGSAVPRGPSPRPPRPHPRQWGGEEDRLAGFDGRCLEVVQSTPAHVCGPRRKGVGHVGFLCAYRKRQRFGELVAFTLLLLGWMR